MTAPAQQFSRRNVFNEDHEAFRDSVRRFIRAEVAPHLGDWRADDGVPRSVVTAAGMSGFLGTTVPECYGGGAAADFGFLAVLIDETLDAGATGLAVLWALHAGVTIPFVLEFGSPEDRHRWLPGLVAGELIGIPAPAKVVRGLPGAKVADLLLVDDGGVITLLPTDPTVVRVTAVAGSLAAPEAAMADIEVAESGPRHQSRIRGVEAALYRDMDLWLSVVALASTRRAIGLAIDYVNSRRVFGRLLAEFENTRLRLAELSAELATATTYVDQCLTARATSQLTAVAAAAARYVTVALSDRATDQSLQLHGGYGYMREYPIAQAFPDARFIRAVGQLYSDPRHAVAARLFNDR